MYTLKKYLLYVLHICITTVARGGLCYTRVRFHAKVHRIEVGFLCIEYQKFPFITRTIFSHSRSERFGLQNTYQFFNSVLNTVTHLGIFMIVTMGPITFEFLFTL